jgi:hypothetical protein
MPTEYYGFDTANGHYSQAEITLLHEVVSRQLNGAIQALTIGGGGVISFPDSDAFKVTAGSDLAVAIAPGMGVARSTTQGAVIMSGVNVNGTTRTGFNGALGNLPPNRGSGNKLYIFAKIYTTGTAATIRSLLPAFEYSDFETMDGGILLAEVQTDSSNVLSVVDRRTMISLGGTGGGDMLKADYDSDDDGKVDAAEDTDTLEGHPASYFATDAALDAHIANTSNPHGVTKAQVGLSNVPNTDATQRSNHTGTQAASTISDFDATVRANRLDQMAAPTADVSLNSQKITNLADGVASTDAATVGQVDAARSGLSLKDPVRAATTANISLTGEQTIDGVACVTGDRVLVKDQTAASENGIYVVAAGAWARSSDANASGEVMPGLACWVNEGSTNADKRFALTTNAPITLNTTALTFAQDSASGGVTGVTGGNGITSSGGTTPDIAFAPSELSEKTTPVDADSIVSVDSEDSGAPKKITFTNWKVWFLAWFNARPNTFTQPITIESTFPAPFVIKQVGLTLGARFFQRARGSVIAPEAVQNGDGLNTDTVQAYDGTDYVTAVQTETQAAAAPTTGAVPGRWRVRLADATGTLTEAIRCVAGRVGINLSADPAASAALEIGGTTGGVLIPRLTTTQRDAISSPATGLIIFNTTTGVFQFYSGAAWASIGIDGAPFTVQTINSMLGSASNDATQDAFQAKPSSTLLANYRAFAAYAPSASAPQWYVGKNGEIVVNAPSGFTGNLIDLQLNGAARFSVNQAGNGSFAGTLAATGNITGSANVRAASASVLGFTSRSSITSPADGNLRLTNNNANDFGLLQLGGTTSSFPAWKRNSAAMQARLADDSANAVVHAKSITIDEQSAPSTPASGTHAVYAKTDSQPYSKNAAGVEKSLWDRAPATLTDAATIAVDASLSCKFKVTLGGNRTLGNPTNAYDGQILIFDIKQDGTGSRVLTLDTKYRFGSSLASGDVVLTTTAGKKDILVVKYDSADDKFDVVDFVKGF